MENYNDINFKNKDIDKLSSSKDSSRVVTENKLLGKWMPTDVVVKKGPQDKMSPKELVGAGLFKEKNGDLFPTAKYEMLKKTGGLKKYGL